MVSGTEPGSRGSSRPGVDEVAIAEARWLGLAAAVHAADWRALGRKACPTPQARQGAGRPREPPRGTRWTRRVPYPGVSG